VIFPGKIVGTYQVGRSPLWTPLELFCQLVDSGRFPKLAIEARTLPGFGGPAWTAAQLDASPLRGQLTGLLYFDLPKRDHAVMAELHDSAVSGVTMSLAR
jgi:hypothetical protein